MPRITVSKRWYGPMAAELFDVASLLKQLHASLTPDDFRKALRLIVVEWDECREIFYLLNSRELRRERHSVAPGLEQGQVWTKPAILQTFQWVNRFRADIWDLAAEVLDLARIIKASPQELESAGKNSPNFNRMTAQNWETLLKSGTTSFGGFGGNWDKQTFEQNVRGSAFLAQKAEAVAAHR